MLEFLKPQKGRPTTWRRFRWWERAVHRLVYDLLPVRRCYWCGRWYVSHYRYAEYCSGTCAGEDQASQELDLLSTDACAIRAARSRTSNGEVTD